VAYTVTATFSGEQRKVESVQPITMFILNASQSGTEYLYYARYNQDVYGFQMNSSGNLTATEQLYTSIPIGFDNIKSSTEGEIAELNISVPNVDRTIEAYIQNNDYLRGNEGYVLTTFARFLPSGSTAYHIGVAADKNAVMKEKMFIDLTTSNKDAVTFSCKPKFVIKNVIVPSRRFIRECSWTYLSSDCDYSGSVNSASYPTCNYTLENCRIRNNSARFGGFAGIPRRGLTVI